MRMSFALSARTTAAAALGVAALGLGMVAPATAAPAPVQAGFTADSADSAATRAFFQAVLKSVAEKQAVRPKAAAAVTVVYDASCAVTRVESYCWFCA